MRQGDLITQTTLDKYYLVPMYNKINFLTADNFQNLSTGQFIMLWTATVTFASAVTNLSAQSELLNCYSEQYFYDGTIYNSDNTASSTFFDYFTKRIKKLKAK